MDAAARFHASLMRCASPSLRKGSMLSSSDVCVSLMSKVVSEVIALAEVVAETFRRS